jgi:hypothetical protein
MATLRRNPVEHGNIRVIKSGGQARYCAIGLRYHDLRMRDHLENSCDRWATAGDQPQFIDSMNPASLEWPWSATQKRQESVRKTDCYGCSKGSPPSGATIPWYIVRFGGLIRSTFAPNVIGFYRSRRPLRTQIPDEYVDLPQPRRHLPVMLL